MAVRSTIRVLFYAIDGTGLGHLSRLLAVARDARDLVEALGHRADFCFLTTSEASQAAWDFPVYKIPSKTVARESGASPRSFAAAAKILISNVVAAVRPDVLVLDTVAEGSFREFLFLKDYARRTAFIDRHKDTATSRSDAHQSHLALYDLVLVPDHADATKRYPIQPTLVERRRFVGPIHGYRGEEALDRATVRARFGVDADDDIVYVSAGGGGDRHAAAALETLIDVVAAEPRTFVLVGYGPLYRGERVYRRNVVPLAEGDVWRFFPGVDFAVCAAGYNTYQELLAAGVPSLLFAQEKGLDRQDERIVRGAERGWHRVLSALDPHLLRVELATLREPHERERIRDALEARPRSEGRLRAAVELLALAATVDRTAIDRGELFTAACLRRRWPRVRLELARDVAASRDDESMVGPVPGFATAYEQMSWWDRWARADLDRDAERDRHLIAWRSEQDDAKAARRDRGEIAFGARLARWQQRVGLTDADWRRFIRESVGDASAEGCARVASRRRIVEDVLERVCEGLPPAARAGFLLEARESLQSTQRLVGLQELTDGLMVAPEDDTSSEGGRSPQGGGSATDANQG